MSPLTPTSGRFLSQQRSAAGPGPFEFGGDAETASPRVKASRLNEAFKPRLAKRDWLAILKTIVIFACGSLFSWL